MPENGAVDEPAGCILIVERTAVRIADKVADEGKSG